eukprot:scaffold2481_cov145-Skeletonema_menzelii.AAC.3
MVGSDGLMNEQNGKMSGEKSPDGATVDDAAVKPDNNFIAGLKRLAKERRAAYDGANNEKAPPPAAGEDADKLEGGNRTKTFSNHNPNGNGVVNESKQEDVPDMTGKIISVSTENQPPRSDQPQSKSQPSQQPRRGDSKQKSKKKSCANPKKKPTSITQLQDGLLPDMTGKEILVEQSELPSIEPVKEEIDLDDLISEEQSNSTNKWRNTGASSALVGGAAGTSKSVNRRGLLTRSRSLKSNLTNSSTSDGSDGGGRAQLFAYYNDQSQRSLQTQTTVGTSGNHTHDDSDSPQNQQQISEPPQVISSYGNRNLRPSNSRRDRASSLHLSFQNSKPTLGRIPSGGILPDVEEGKISEETQSKLSLNTSSKSTPSRAQSWANLIALDEHNKRASMDMGEVEEEEADHSSSINPRKTNGLRSSRTSVKSQESINSRGSRRSKRSNSDGRRRNRIRNSSSEDWKNESTLSNSLTLSQMKDPDYIRTQATERFDRGLEYADLGKLDAARERLLIALRYRVMDRGSLHPDVAATHEMLGYVEYFTAENKKNDDFEGSLVRLDHGADGLLGGNLTIMENPDKDGQSPSSSRGKSHYEKAAMHFQTALDILDAKELGLSNPNESTWVNGTSSKEETTFQWRELAGTYTLLDEKGRLGVEERIEIVSRIQERMDELPVTVGEKSYATSFLSSFH